ncbi:MAG: LytR/AlgR family response regulator transcription factor [Bacteroidota bacterium]
MENKIKVIIIDDEAPARRLIAGFLDSYNDLEIVAQCTDGFEGIKKINEFKPDLVFLDIQMPRINGVEMLELLDADHLPLTIFTTAYDEYAVKSFEYNTCDYLLKPINEKRFEKALEKARNQLQSPRVSAEGKLGIKSLLKEGISEKYLDRLVIRSGNHIQVVHCDELICLEANDDYVIVHTEKEQWLKKQTLRHYEKKLAPDNFLRVHRSFIINLTAISRIEPYSKDAWIAIMNNGMKVAVSKAGYARLKETMNF